MKKTLFSLLLAAALLLSLFPAALAEDVTLVEPAVPSDPAQPTVSMSTAGLTLRWDAVAGAERYELSRGDGDGIWLALATLTDTRYTDTDVQMGELCSYRVRALVGGTWTLCCESQALLFNPFSDVSGPKTVEYVAWAYNNGVVKGKTPTRFGTDEDCTRIQFILMLWKMNGSPSVSGENPFSDVSGSKTVKAVLWALDKGIINAAARFYPDESISRVQTVMILWKLAGSPDAAGESPFTDLSGGKTVKAVLWAYQNGIAKGTGAARFSPDKPCTRVQLVTFLYKFHRLPAPAAKRLSLRVRYNGAEQSVAADGKYTTTLRVAAGGSLQLSAEEKIGALYILWEEYPQPWTLRSGEREERHGENGFLHELVRVQNPAAELELRVSGSQSAQIADIYAFTAGSLPDWVQDWQLPWDEADLLVVPTHSDDEFIFMGGVIPAYVEKGMRVQVMYLVRHTHNRRHEQLNSLWVAGVNHVPIISECDDVYVKTVDEARYYYNTDYLTGYLVEQLRRFRPKVVVGHAENGDSGHAVHILGVMCLKNAVNLAAKSGAYPASERKYGLWDLPKLYLHLYGPTEQMTVLDYETPLSRFGGRTAYQVACDAFDQCVSQTAKGYYEIYSFGSPHDTHRWGLYRSLVGPDESRDDLFENLDRP